MRTPADSEIHAQLQTRAGMNSVQVEDMQPKREEKEIDDGTSRDEGLKVLVKPEVQGVQ